MELDKALKRSKAKEWALVKQHPLQSEPGKDSWYVYCAIVGK